MTKSKSSKKTEAPTEAPEVPEQIEEAMDETSKETIVEGAPEEETIDADALKVDDTTVADAEIVDDVIEGQEPQSVDTDASEPSDTTEPRLEPLVLHPEKTVVVQKTGFLPTLAAGVLAAGAGFIAAQYSSQSWPFEPGPSTDPLAVAQSAQEDVAALADRVTETENALAAPQDAAPDLSGIEAQLSELNEGLLTLQQRVTALEERPVAAPEAPAVDMSGFESEISGLQSQVAELVAEANVAEATAAAAANAQLARAALARVMASLETGTPFGDALNELQGASAVTVPEVLEKTASEGVPTLAGLQQSFDPIARDALAAARAGTPDQSAGVSDRLTSFLRARTGARSVEPRNGDDPDAVLSRVGASIATGNISDALAEAEALPETARSAMTEWLSQAEMRQQALAAADSLAQQLNSN